MASENASSGVSGSNNKDMEFNSWVNSMQLMLGCVDNQIVEACSIFVVPEELGKSKVEAYTPRKVSIGPLHRGATPDLIYMEDIKWRCMKHLLKRTEDPEKSLNKCSKAISDLDQILRASYNVDDIKFKSYDLAKILLLDGCFLLELLMIVISSESEESNEVLKIRKVVLSDLVLSDLTVLGNQIPFIILSKLATLLFPEKEAEIKITKYVLSLLGYSLDSTMVYSFHNFHPVHVLGLVHSFITLETERVFENEKNQYSSINVYNEKFDKREREEMRQLKLKRCATRLEASGVTITPPAGKSESNSVALPRFDLKITFSDGKLEIPSLHITETTEVKWRNFIAWELTKSPYSKSIVDQKDGIGCKFIWYAFFFQGLICSIHDIQLLRDRKVIVVHDAERSSLGKRKEKINNEALLSFFRNITEGVHDDQIVKDYQFCKLFQDLNSHPTHLNRVIETSRITDHFCRRVLTEIWFSCRKSFKMLRRDHIPTRWKLILAVTAFVLFACTFIKTFFPHLIH